jgi:hypothetical protein
MECPLLGGKADLIQRQARLPVLTGPDIRPLGPGPKNAYARVEGIGGGIGNEATRVHHTDWRRAVRLLKRLFQRLLILGLGILSIWLIVFVIFETADRRLPWLLALGLTYAIAAYIVLPRAIRIGLKILQRKLVPSFTITGDGLPGDPVNLALIGTLPQLRTAFAALGWSEADRLSMASSWRKAVKVVQSGQRLPAERVNHYITDGEVTLASLVINDA